MMSTLEEAKKTAQVRSSVYSLLSQCFFQPSEELVAYYIQGDGGEFLESTVGILNGKVVEELIRIKDFNAQAQDKSTGEILRDLKVEYNRLFVGPGHVLAPPYESVYKTRNEDNKLGVVMGDDTIAVKKFYREAGLEIDDNFTDLPDHIAVELYFMSYLCNLEFLSVDEGEEGLAQLSKIKEMQKEFLKTHLGTWISDFTQAINKETNSDFYRGIAKITEEWIMWEIKELH